MRSLLSSRGISIAIIAAIYIAAAIIGWFVYVSLGNAVPSPLWRLFLADVVATVIVWMWGLVYRNVSVYDPYWSVFPPVAMTLWAVHSGTMTLSTWLVLVAIWLWAIRLTGNWAFTFKGLQHEDWRYAKYRNEQKPFMFHIINFFGLNMMPTVLVFLAMLPGLEIVGGCYGTTWLTWVGFFVCIAATLIELVADTQRHRFAREHKGEICNVGLWKHGRHPNYFGEIMMWWGMFVMYVSVPSLYETCCVGFHAWYIIGPVLMTGLFLFVSIPLMEKRQLKNKPGYAEYKAKTRRLI
jgi:Predicted membrane protein